MEVQLRKSGRTASLGQSFSAQHNSLNFLRLFLAIMVVAGHSLGLGGFRSDQILNNTSVGTIAVFGFFGISGYLITASASKNNLGRYLWQRFLRIFPAFWVCLLVTVSIFGIIGWARIARPGCDLSCYFDARDGPLQYLAHNGLLHITQFKISGGPAGIQPVGWNGSLWTLFYEFICYVVLGAIAVAGLLRRRRAVLAFAILVWVLEVVVVSSPVLNEGIQRHPDLMYLLTFAPVFFGGALLYLYRDSVPDSGFIAAAFVGAFALSLFMPVGKQALFWSETAANFVAPALAYPVLWLGIHLPFQKVGARNDYSYGTYIYAFPVQQTLALWGVNRLGLAAYFLLSMAGTAPFAVASWWVIEKRALALKKARIRGIFDGNRQRASHAVPGKDPTEA